jgi:hypothetical protein
VLQLDLRKQIERKVVSEQVIGLSKAAGHRYPQRTTDLVVNSEIRGISLLCIYIDLKAVEFETGA